MILKVYTIFFDAFGHKLLKRKQTNRHTKRRTLEVETRPIIDWSIDVLKLSAQLIK